MPADTLRAHPGNFRRHPPAQRAALRDLLREVGFADAVVARRTPEGALQILDGHLRAEVAGRADVPVVVVDLTDAEAAKFLATADPLTGMAETDGAAARALTAAIETESAAVRQLLARVAAEDGADVGGGTGTARPEIAISPELHERQDYLVIVFENAFDWQVACERLGVTMVRCPPNGRSTIQQRALGRVVPAARLLAAMGEAPKGSAHV